MTLAGVLLHVGFIVWAPAGVLHLNPTPGGSNPVVWISFLVVWEMPLLLMPVTVPFVAVWPRVVPLSHKPLFECDFTPR
jgi:hypothetical protein